mmetsp:Transcript_7254/g.14750  ORF Transcript_7254/g.14750 Transcript_7254/m.14750 type:complete len:327 (-) Transcript_7254:114-1094(-)
MLGGSLCCRPVSCGVRRNFTRGRCQHGRTYGWTTLVSFANLAMIPATATLSSSRGIDVVTFTSCMVSRWRATSLKPLALSVERKSWNSLETEEERTRCPGTAASTSPPRTSMRHTSSTSGMLPSTAATTPDSDAATSSSRVSRRGSFWRRLMERATRSAAGSTLVTTAFTLSPTLSTSPGWLSLRYVISLMWTIASSPATWQKAPKGATLVTDASITSPSVSELTTRRLACLRFSSSSGCASSSTHVITIRPLVASTESSRTKICSPTIAASAASRTARLASPSCSSPSPFAAAASGLALRSSSSFSRLASQRRRPGLIWLRGRKP